MKSLTVLLFGFFFLSFVFFSAVPAVSFAANKYVRAGASGSGSDWNNNQGASTAAAVTISVGTITLTPPSLPCVAPVGITSENIANPCPVPFERNLSKL